MRFHVPNTEVNNPGFSILGAKKRGIARMNHFKGRHFQKDIILVAVGYYFRFSLSYRDIVELLRDRGITVHHTTVMRWVHHYGPIFKNLSSICGIW